MVQSIPEGYYSVTPHLVISQAGKAIEFYKAAFGAEEVSKMLAPDGKQILHATLRIGNSMIMLCDEFLEAGCRSPQTLGGTPIGLHIYLENVDSAFDRALQAGCQVMMPLTNTFWGDRYGKLKDPFGYEWSLATHIQDIDVKDMKFTADCAV